MILRRLKNVEDCRAPAIHNLARTRLAARKAGIAIVLESLVDNYLEVFHSHSHPVLNRELATRGIALQPRYYSRHTLRLSVSRPGRIDRTATTTNAFFWIFQTSCLTFIPTTTEN